jgi:hypothetical protein
MYRDIYSAMTFPEIQAAINDAARIDYDADPQLVRAQLPPRLGQLVIGPEGTGGLLTQTECKILYGRKIEEEGI